MRGDGKPAWLTIRPPRARYTAVRTQLAQASMVTVCQEARCPNLSDCWSGGTATFMILGDTCTRGCRFCAVKTSSVGTTVDSSEPVRLVASVAALQLSYVVLTMVDRDDLLDGGAAHVASCVRALKKAYPALLVEVLIGDFAGNEDALAVIASSGVDVVAHNVETVARLQSVVRDRRASYARSLDVLRYFSSRGFYTKSSLMLGLGETSNEVYQTLQDLRSIEVSFVTLGQYLQPSAKHLPVDSFVSPEAFTAYADYARSVGFLSVASGPLVRSSYKAGELFISHVLGGDAV